MFLRLFTQSHSMASIALSGRNIQKLPIRNQMFRQVHREQISSRQSLKEKLMAPAGPNGSLDGGEFTEFQKTDGHFQIEFQPLD